MPSRAARRPARLERTPRRTRATAPAHSNPSCPCTLFFDFNSLIASKPPRGEPGPKQRTPCSITPLAPRTTPIAPGCTFLASMTAAINSPIENQRLNTSGLQPPPVLPSHPGTRSLDRFQQTQQIRTQPRTARSISYRKNLTRTCGQSTQPHAHHHQPRSLLPDHRSPRIIPPTSVYHQKL